MIQFSDVELGPKMQVCSPQERKFVWHYLLDRGSNATDAARLSGYVDNGGAGIRVTAHKIVHRERVLEAIEEVGRRMFRAQLGKAIQANEDLIDNKDHPDHWKAVHATLSRNGLIERTGVDVNVTGEISVNHTDAALADLRALVQLGVPRDKLVETFGFSGLARYEAMLAEKERGVSRETKVIEHRTEEVK